MDNGFEDLTNFKNPVNAIYTFTSAGNLKSATPSSVITPLGTSGKSRAPSLSVCGVPFSQVTIRRFPRPNGARRPENGQNGLSRRIASEPRCNDALSWILVVSGGRGQRCT